MGREVHIVSHSHWDREWHQTFQQFRLRLARVIDNLLDALAADPSFLHFMLDGQTILLEDYAEVRPERVAELRAQIAAGRITIGPWYVHPDEFLVSGEALVRNLLLGARLCAAWDGGMAVGYVPDQFGHIAQLPQIWRGFGIERSVLWRGVDRAVARTAFHWRAPDGSAVLVGALPFGYNQAEYLPMGGQALAEQLRALIAALEPLAEPGQPLLIMHGGDHTGVQAGLPAALAAAQTRLGEQVALTQSTLSVYLAALAGAGASAATIEGELRSSRSAFLLPGVLSSRMWIKQRNGEAQTLLERQAEPLAAMGAALGDPYPAGELRLAWRYLVQNHPHDSICGCSIDQVHREMITRFDWCIQIAAALREDALGALAARVDSLLPGAQDPHTLALTVFNGAPVPQGGRIEARLRLAGEAGDYELVEAGGTPVPHLWLGERGEPSTQVEVAREDVPELDTLLAQLEGDRVMGLGVASVSMRTVGEVIHLDVTVGDQVILNRDQIERAAHDALALADEAGARRAALTIHRATSMHLVAQAPEVPASGYRTLLLRPRGRAARHEAEPAPAELLPVIANEHYRIEVDPASGGALITMRADGTRLGPVNLFVDGGEGGDLYTHQPPAHDALFGPTDPPTVERAVDPLGQHLLVRQVLRVPRALAPSRYERDEERVDLAIETCVSLAPGDRLIRCTSTVENTAADHRLRVHFPLPFAADHAHVEDAFALTRRAARPGLAGVWAETPVGTAPHQGVIALHGQGRAFLLAARGLPEYEVSGRADGGADLALTLLRCTGWLSRGDLAARPGEAGPALPTPDAQCPGRHTFHYALACGPEPWRDLLPVARAFAVPLHTHVVPCAEGFLPATASLAAITPPTMVLSALKGAEDGRGSILRFYNEGLEPGTARIQLLLPVVRVTRVDLAERDGAVLFMGEPRTAFSVEAGSASIVSLRLEWG